jgi:hypothetical protein
VINNLDSEVIVSLKLLGSELLQGIERKKVEDDGLVVDDIWVCGCVRVCVPACCLALGLVDEGECDGCADTGDFHLRGRQREGTVQYVPPTSRPALTKRVMLRRMKAGQSTLRWTRPPMRMSTCWMMSLEP